MKTERRWLKSVLAAAAQPQPALPFERGARRRPAAFPRRALPAAAARTAVAAR